MVNGAMTILSVTDFLTVILILLWIGYFGFLAYRKRAYMTRSVTLKMLGGGGLSLYTGISHSISNAISIDTLRFAFSAISVPVFHYALLLFYLAIDQLINSQAPHSTFKRRLFWCTTLFALIVIVLTYLGRCDLDAFLRNGSFPSSTVCYNSYLLDTWFRSYLLALTIFSYWRSFRLHLNLVYIVRRCFGIASVLISLSYTISIEIALMLTLIWGDYYRAYLTYPRDAAYLLAMSLLSVGFLLPEPMLVHVLRPVSAYIQKKRGKEQELLGYLHKKMIQIVPGVHLQLLPEVQSQFKQLCDIRIPIEISDARQILWSRRQCQQLIAPEDEAKHLFCLLQQQIVIHEPGNFLPPHLRYRNVKKHNLVVAKRLQVLEMEYISTIIN